MPPSGPRVKLRAVVGGVFLVWYGQFLYERWSAGLPMWVLAGCLGLLLLSAAGLAAMFRKTRTARQNRGLGLWLLETLKLTGTLVIALLVLFLAVHGCKLLAR